MKSIPLTIYKKLMHVLNFRYTLVEKYFPWRLLKLIFLLQFPISIAYHRNLFPKFIYRSTLLGMWIIMSFIILCHHHVVSCQTQVYHLWFVNYITCFEYLGSSLITSNPSWDITQGSLHLVVRYRSLCLDTFLVTMASCIKGLTTWWAIFSTC